MTRNRVWLNGDIIEIDVVGNQTTVSVQRMGTRALALSREQRTQGRRALVLDDVTQIGQVPPEARRLVMELVKSSDYDRLAMLGRGTLIKLGANLILQASGRGEFVRYFDDRAAALAWLRG